MGVGYMLSIIWLVCIIILLWIGFKTWGPSDDK